jgi:enterochelin esterase-like enzyme
MVLSFCFRLKFDMLKLMLKSCRFFWIVPIGLSAVLIVLVATGCSSTRIDQPDRSPIDLSTVESTYAPTITPRPTGSIAPPTITTASVCTATLGQIVTITIASSIYGQSVPAAVYLPPCQAESTAAYPVIYLLHGGSADQTQWPDLNVQLEADALIQSGTPPFIVVMPGGDYRPGLDYATFVLDDLRAAIAQRYRVKTDRADQSIGGLSLGGYWALKIAFLHPDLFAAVGGYSPVVDLGQADDPLPLARTADGLSTLRIMLDVGDVDPLRGSAQQLARQLEDRSITIAFSINPGGHNRAYWRSHTGAYLRFLRASSP